MKTTDVPVTFIINGEEETIYVDSGAFYNLAIEAMKKGVSVQDLMIEKFGEGDENEV